MKTKSIFTAIFILALLYESAFLHAQTYFAGTGAGAGNTGSLVTGVGTFAVGSSNSGTNVAAFGSNALFKNTTGNSNSAFGSNSLYNNTTGKANSGLGKSVLYRNTSGDSNTAAGFHAMYNNTTGINNTSAGSFSLFANSTGSNNTSIGASAMRNNTSGAANSASGFNAMAANTLGYSNTASGAYSLFRNTTGSRNTAIGDSAMLLNTTGNENTAIGYTAMYSNLGIRNAATGAYSLRNNTIGSDNSAFGFRSMELNTTGGYNTASGSFALSSNTTGENNSAFGAYSLGSNNMGMENTAVGYASLAGSSGSKNTGIGTYALYESSTNNYNTAVGYRTGAGYFTGWSQFIIGSQCTFIGAQSDITANNIFNSTAIGYNSKVDASNKVVIGNTAVTSIGGQVGWTTYSDRNLKMNISKSILGLEFIKALNPVTYNYKAEGQKDILYTGLIAQEVDEAAKKAGAVFSGVDKNGAYWGIRYGDLTVPLIKAVQELEEHYKSRIEQLELKLIRLEKAAEERMGEASSLTLRPSLYQNQPNPFTAATLIRYCIPEEAIHAEIIIRDLNGRMMRVIRLSEMGKGSISLQAGNLSAGTYTYSLIASGECVDTKILVITR